MKKTVAILLIAVMALSFIACSAKKNIIGTWELTEVEGADSNTLKLALSMGYVITITFTEDGKYEIVTHAAGEVDEVSTGKYKVRGSKLFLDDDNSHYFNLVFKDNQMIWKGDGDNSQTYTKK